MFRRGLRAGGPIVVVHARPHTQTHATRVGFVVSKAVGNAVIRNRVKRRLRSLMAERLENVPDMDVVIRALPPAAHAEFGGLKDALDAGLRRVARKVGSR